MKVYWEIVHLLKLICCVCWSQRARRAVVDAYTTLINGNDTRLSDAVHSDPRSPRRSASLIILQSALWPFSFQPVFWQFFANQMSATLQTSTTVIYGLTFPQYQNIEHLPLFVKFFAFLLHPWHDHVILAMGGECEDRVTECATNLVRGRLELMLMLIISAFYWGSCAKLLNAYAHAVTDK
jgi:hypothetical protein